MEHVPHDYLVLIPLSFSGREGSRLFEMKTVELLVDQCGFDGLRLGETDRPDGLIFTQKLTEDYGVIIDTKAYSKSFNIPRPEADKMTRYVNENIQRDPRHSPKWWEHFPSDVNLFKFLFVSSKFGGKYENQLQRISRSTQGHRWCWDYVSQFVAPRRGNHQRENQPTRCSGKVQLSFRSRNKLGLMI